MDIEHLSKSQIVLLALLCTFVASIATAIVTVSLLAQAPPAVTQTVNHVIQRTVEAVAPTTNTTTTVKETTVVVKEDELVTDTISKSFAKIGVVHESEATTSPVVALGTMVGSVLITDASVSVDTHAVTFGEQVLYFTVSKRFAEIGIALMTPEEDGAVPAGFRIADTSAAKLGQSVIALPSASGTRVGIGAVVARYTLGRVPDGKDEVPVRAIETNISGKVSAGAPLLNSFGDILGIATQVALGPAGGAGTFVSVSDLSPFLSSVKGTSTPAVTE
jgi:hypothetical protein